MKRACRTIKVGGAGCYRREVEATDEREKVELAQAAKLPGARVAIEVVENRIRIVAANLDQARDELLVRASRIDPIQVVPKDLSVPCSESVRRDALPIQS